jgi:hypothetical protein
MKTLTTLCFLLVIKQSIAQSGFVENKGQWDKQAACKFSNGITTVFLNTGGYTVIANHPEDYARNREYQLGHINFSTPQIDGRITPSNLRCHIYKVNFKGADFSKPAVMEDPFPGYENFFIGNDPSLWASECKSYRKVTYKNIYRNIDLVYYFSNNTLKYDLIVHPGGNISNIRLNYEGINGLKLENNQLKIETSTGIVNELQPYTYQKRNDTINQIECSYQVNGTDVTFTTDKYDHEKSLIIDPSIIFSSYSNSISDNWGFSATYASDGSLFGAGIANTNGFPVSIGAFQTSGGGGTNSQQPSDIAIIKLSSDGSTRIYATYLGGNGIDQPHSIIADANDNLVIMGRTNSTNFPGNQFGVGGGYDIYVTKLNAGGTGLIGSIKIGGSGMDGVNISLNPSNGPNTIMQHYAADTRSDVTLDETNNILITGCTQSQNFPVKNGFQSSSNGLQDAVVFKVNETLTDVIWSTYFGGSGNDGGFSITKKRNDTFFIAGGTSSASGLPGLLPSSFQNSYSGGVADGFCLKLIDLGTSVTVAATTYFGTAQTDIIYGVQTDNDGGVYITGTTEGFLPVVNAAYSNSNAKQFITKILPDLTAVVYSTTFGTQGALAPNIVPCAFFVDSCENVFVAGWGGGSNLLSQSQAYPNVGTSNMFITNDAYQTATDGSDFYFFVLQKDAFAPLYASYFGQVGGIGSFDHTHSASRFSNNGTLYLSTCANCKTVFSDKPLVNPYPITPGVFSETNIASTGGQCNMGLLKFDLNLSSVCKTTTVNNPTSVNSKHYLVVSPNPNSGQFTVRYYHPVTSARNSLQVIDMFGRKIQEHSFRTNGTFNDFKLNLPSTNSGVYVVEILDARGNRIATGKFLTNK